MGSFICDDKQVLKKTVAVRSRQFDSGAWRGAELWDLLDEDGMPVGAAHVRGEKLPHGAYHRVVEIFTINSKGELLVTAVYPHFFECCRKTGNHYIQATYTHGELYYINQINQEVTHAKQEAL